MKTHILSGSTEEWHAPPWPLARELASILPSGSWVLVGGLMVRIHALLRSINPGRATTDVDAVVVLMKDGGKSYTQLASILKQNNFSTNDGDIYTYRFIRTSSNGVDQVDLMFSDRVAARSIPRFQGRPVFRVPGSTRALQTREEVHISDRGSKLMTLQIPSLQGALVLKGAASIEDSRNPGRHLTDALTLLACIDSPQEIYQGLSAMSRKRIRALLRGLDAREPWTLVDEKTRALARDIFPEMCSLFDVSGTAAR